MSENKNPSIYKMRRIGDASLEYLSQHCSCESEVFFKCPECGVADEIKELRGENAQLKDIIRKVCFDDDKQAAWDYLNNQGKDNG